MSFFEANHITAGYSNTPVIRDISFSLDRGQVLGLLGANGCGKTTLLKAICGILPHEGHCRIESAALESLSARQIAQRISYIPQRSGISIDISALDVVLMGFNPQLGLLESPTSAMVAAAKDALAAVGLAHAADKNYQHFSEGQKQLCILARTIVSGCALLVLDEPESALDFSHRHRMLTMLHHAIGQTRSSAIVTLHDPMLALNFCDRLLLLPEHGAPVCLSPSSDAPQDMVQKLSRLYGAVSLHVCTTRTGVRQLVMLKEDDA